MAGSTAVLERSRAALGLPGLPWNILYQPWDVPGPPSDVPGKPCEVSGSFGIPSARHRAAWHVPGLP